MASWMMGNPAKLLRKETLIESSQDGSRLMVVTLTFSNPPGMDTLGVRLDMGDVVKVCVPDYKPKSYSMSAEREGEFDLTVKVYPGGRASGYLDRVQIGEDITVFRKGNKQHNPGNCICLIAYGVGITEAFPIAVAELGKSDTSKVMLIWALRTQEEMFWKDEINSIKENYPDRFDLIQIFSREQVDGALHGRVNPDMIVNVLDTTWWKGQEVSDEDRNSVRFLSVGTKEMMRETDAMLCSIGYDMPKHKLLN